MKNKNRNTKRTNAGWVAATGLLLLAGWILVFLARWVFSTWAGLRMDELIFQLKAPIEGTGDGIVMICSQYWGRRQTGPMKKIMAFGIRIALPTRGE